MAKNNSFVLSTLCYIHRNDKTLMLHRVKRDRDVHEGKWNGLGGKFLPGETPETCVKREVLEESGLVIENPRLRGVMTFPDFKAGEDWHVYLFTVNRFSGELKECDEGNLEWIDDSKIKDLNLWQGDHLFLDWLKKGQFFSARFVYQQKKLTEHSVVFY